MPLTNPKDIIVRISNGYGALDNFSSNIQQASRTLLLTGATAVPSISMPKYFNFPDMPSLPSGVSAFMPLEMMIHNSAFNTGTPHLWAEVIDLGSLNIATNVFTDGAQMPTRTVFNASKQLDSPVYCEFEGTLAGTARVFTITYVDQDGNAAETTANITANNSAGVWAGATLPLNAGDWGVRDITAANFVSGTGSPTGTLRFYGLVPIIMYTPMIIAAISSIADFINFGIIRRLGAGAKSSLFILSTTASASAFTGYVRMVGDT